MTHLAADASVNPGQIIGGVLLAVVLIALYWAPTFIALKRHVPGIGQVVIVNLFLGWTLIGWVVALVMAFRPVPSTPVVPMWPHSPALRDDQGSRIDPQRFKGS